MAASTRTEHLARKSREYAEYSVGMLLSEGITSGIVFVTGPNNWTNPIAVRTLENQGFGYVNKDFLQQQQKRIASAREYAHFANTYRRGYYDQMQKLRQTGRTARTYGPNFSDLLTSARSGYSVKTGVTMTVISEQFRETSSENGARAQWAIDQVDEEISDFSGEPERTDSLLLRILSQNLIPELNPGESATAMVVFPELPTENWDHEPILTCLQSVGSFNSGLYDVVSAKAYSTINSRYPSGDKRSTNDLKEIPGAQPLEIFDQTERILAVGGLQSSADDIKVIYDSIGELPELGFLILGKLSQRRYPDFLHFSS